MGLALIARGKATPQVRMVPGVSTAPAPLTPRSVRLLPARSSAPTEAELEILEQYINSSRVLNRSLRSGKLVPGVEARVEKIDTWMRNASPTEGRYYRGIASEKDAEFFRTASVGDTYNDRGYGSFSSVYLTARQFAEETAAGAERVIVRTRAPFYAMPTEAIDTMARHRGTFDVSAAGEDEFLAPRGASYRVTKIRSGIPTEGRNRLFRKYTLVDLEYTGVDNS